jgi:ParB-like nuclease domain
MTETLHIPLNKLAAWDGNVRRTGATDGIDELAASIAAHGLLQAPVVRKEKRGRFSVIAGRRRLLALNLLAPEGTIPADYTVPCQLANGDADASEISLAENAAPCPPAWDFRPEGPARPGCFLSNGSARDLALPQVLEAQQHDEHEPK